MDLRPYQNVGAKFLAANEGALLADEMGLGKTIQAIAAVKLLIAQQRLLRVLIVAPAALQTNWAAEIGSWAPDVPWMRIIGDQEDRLASYQLPIAVQIASYEQIRVDAILMKLSDTYDLVILDEAQRIKNQDSSTALACRMIPRSRSWALTGTPLENTLDDFRSILLFIKPELRPSDPRSNGSNSDFTPFVLRRRIRDVIPELPAVIDRVIRIDLNSEQRKSYEEIRHEATLVADDPSSSNMVLFAQLTKLKQACNFDAKTNSSSKLAVLKDILLECGLSGKKSIVFSQYVETLHWLAQHLPAKPSVYHGGLTETERDYMVDDFRKSPHADVLLMSLRAGGVGLNLQFASVIILFDRWWNPATESQAVSRVIRIGQKDIVLVYRFVSVDTIEERIEHLLKVKDILFDQNVNVLSVTAPNTPSNLRSLIARA